MAKTFADCISSVSFGLRSLLLSFNIRNFLYVNGLL